MATSKFRTLFREFLILLGITVILTPVFFMYGTPFMEGSWEIDEGRRYGFAIGMTREECFEVIKIYIIVF